MKKTPRLLQNNSDEEYLVEIRLQEGRRARFYYTDRRMAEEHYDFLRTTMVIGPYYIREITFDRSPA